MAFREPSGPRRIETGFRKAGAVLLIAIGAATLSACADNEVGATPTTIETPASNLSEQQKIEAALAARPVEGTPEYEAFFDQFAIPYVEGQAPEDVLRAADASTYLWVTSGLEDGPAGKDEALDWAADTGKSLNDLVVLVNPGYFDEPIADEIIGDTAFRQIVVPNISARHTNMLSGVFSGNIPGDAEQITTGVVVNPASTATEVIGTTTTELQGVPDSAGGSSYHLKAVDEDGDGDFDKWNWIGASS